MEKLHLDSEYRNRWLEFHLADGTIEDSRLKNWRQVRWCQVVKLVANLRGHIHTVHCTGSGFLTFMNFRWGGQEPVNGTLRKIKIWTIGWTDGTNCFLKDIDFYTGNFIKNYIEPLSTFKGHLHPHVKNMVLR